MKSKVIEVDEILTMASYAPEHFRFGKLKEAVFENGLQERIILHQDQGLITIDDAENKKVNAWRSVIYWDGLGGQKGMRLRFKMDGRVQFFPDEYGYNNRTVPPKPTLFDKFKLWWYSSKFRRNK